MAKIGRHLARRCVVQALYQWQITGQDAAQILPSFIDHDGLAGKYREYFLMLVAEITRCCKEIDHVIAPHLDRSLDRVDPVEEAILRLGTYELCFDKTIPTRVVIDEAIELAKTFGSEHGYRYVNGVLDKVAKGVRQ